MMELLTVLFIGLKLTGVIDWSWWWVTAPIWGWFLVILAVGSIHQFYHKLVK